MSKDNDEASTLQGTTKSVEEENDDPVGCFLLIDSTDEIDTPIAVCLDEDITLDWIRQEPLQRKAILIPLIFDIHDIPS